MRESHIGLQIADRDIKFIVRLFISKQFEAEASTPTPWTLNTLLTFRRHSVQTVMHTVSTFKNKSRWGGGNFYDVRRLTS